MLAKASDDFYVYFSSKIMAEQAVWKYAEEHPELDIATSESHNPLPPTHTY